MGQIERQFRLMSGLRSACTLFPLSSSPHKDFKSELLR